MIIYNPKDWIQLIFTFHRSDTFRVLLPGMVALGLFTLLVDYLIIDVLQIGHKGTFALHSLLGFVISLLLVFRTNSAYDRWWEGRKLWGTMVNASRDLAMKLNTLLNVDKDEREQWWLLISNYVVSCKHHLRGKTDAPLPYYSTLYPSGRWTQSSHLPLSVASERYVRTEYLCKQRTLADADVWTLHRDIQTLVDVSGACERIKNTPIPFAYSLFIKKFIFIYVVTMPIAFVAAFGYYAIPIVVFVVYILSSLELIAVEIEDIFGEDDNDLSADELCQTISKNTGSLLLHS